MVVVVVVAGGGGGVVVVVVVVMVVLAKAISLLLLLLLVMVVVVVVLAFSLPKKGCPIKKKGNLLKSSQNTVIWSVFGACQEQSNAIYDVILPWEPQNQAKTLVFTMFLQHPKKRT